jgi:hypothetical protein
MSKSGSHSGKAPAAPKKSFGSATEYAKPQASNSKVAGLNPGGGKGKTGPVGR